MLPHDIYKKIKAMRVLKGWSQEETADKLGIALTSYSKIERGETDVSLTRLNQIAEMLGVDLAELVGANGNNIINLVENCTQYCANHSRVKGNILLTESACAHELEKSQLLLAERDKEIAHLHRELAQLQEVVDLLKAREKT